MKLQRHYWSLKVLVGATLILLATSVVNGQTPVAAHGQLSIYENRMLDKNGNAYQLRGMSLFWSNWMGKYWTYETIKWLRDDWNCNVIRAAMGISTSDNSGYLGQPKIEKQKMITAIEAAIDLGIYVIVDWHSHRAETETEAAKEFFAEIAEKYGDYPNIIYETYNEPEAGWSEIKAYHEAVIPSIRQFDENNVIILGTPSYSQVVSVALDNPVAGDNLCYALHYYAASHDFMSQAQSVQDGLKYLFVSEFGTCTYTGDGYVDKAASNNWWTFLDNNQIGWCNWAVSDAPESAAIVHSGASIYGNWSASDLTESGAFVRERLRSYAKDPIPTNIAPYITSNPKTISSPFENTATFSVEAVGENIQYQWYFNDSEISGATNSSFSIPSVTEIETGSYYVILTNSFGSTTSKTANLSVRYRSIFGADTIKIPGVIQFEDYDNGGQNLGYFDTGYGNSGAGYRTDDVDIELIQNTQDEYSIGFTDKGEWLSYTVNIAWSGDYEVDVFYASEPGGGSFSMEIDGIEKIAETELQTSGGWFDYKRLTKSITLTEGTHLIKFNILKTGFNLDYAEIRSMNSPDIAPIFTSEPKNTFVRVAKSAFLYTTALGAQPMAYQWYHDGEAITGANQSALEISSATESDAGLYYVIATNNLGSKQSKTATLTVLNSKAYGGFPAILPGRVACKNFDEGGNGDGYSDNTPGNESSASGDYYREEDVDTEACTDGGTGFSVGYIQANEWLKYSVIANYSGTYTVGFRVASGATTGVPTLSFEIDGVPTISTLAIPNTGGWQAWETIESTFDLVAGNHVITLKANQGDFNINYMDFAIEPVQQEYSFVHGWNLFSLTVQLDDSNISSLLNQIDGAIVKSSDGFYNSNYPDYLNSISEFMVGQGYLVYNSGDEVLVTFEGLPYDNTINSTGLKNGWNLNAGADVQVSDLESSILEIKDLDSFYINGNNSSNLTDLIEGKAYFIKK